MITKKTPIAVFTYNRPHHTLRLLETLANCDRFHECDTYIYCDGTQKEEHILSVNATREVVRNWAAQFNAKVIEQSRNVGPSHMIVDSVTDLCRQYGRVIVLEDDLLLSPSFLHFMLDGLDRYENASSVYQISGYMYPVIDFPKTADAFLMPYTSSWGWATWQRAWSAFEWEPSGMYDLLSDPKLVKKFDMGNSYRFSKVLRSRQRGEGDIYDVVWYYIVFLHKGLGLYPRQSLVWNSGFDGSGMHCGFDESFPQMGSDQVLTTRLDKTFIWPLKVDIDRIAYKRLQKYLQTTFYGKKPLFLRLQQKVNYELNRFGKL